MHHFGRAGGVLHAEGCSLVDLAERHGTPLYVYAAATLERHYRVVDEAFAQVPHLVCYSVKACSNLAVLQLLARLGSGFDIVSGGELARVLAAGGDASKVVFSGVGKRDDEIAAALDAGILAFNVESAFELERIERVARERGRAAPISIRVNPDVDAGAHPYIATGLRTAKFGVDFEAARRMYAYAAASDALDVVGIDAHIGSQILETAPYADALDRIIEMVDVLAADGITLRHLDIGGGLGIPYRDEEPAPPRAFGDVVAARLAGRDMTLVLEPGRVIAGNAGVLLMRVLGVKHNGTRTFVVVDAAMNDNIRPALYQAWQRIEPVVLREGPEQEVDVVGPICETGDFLALERPLPPVQQGDLLAMMSAGAYGFSMSSNYNSRPRAAEVLVRDGEATVVRPREQVSELFAGERLLP